MLYGIGGGEGRPAPQAVPKNFHGGIPVTSGKCLPSSRTPTSTNGGAQTTYFADNLKHETSKQFFLGTSGSCLPVPFLAISHVIVILHHIILFITLSNLFQIVILLFTTDSSSFPRQWQFWIISSAWDLGWVDGQASGGGSGATHTFITTNHASQVGTLPGWPETPRKSATRGPASA